MTTEKELEYYKKQANRLNKEIWNLVRASNEYIKVHPCTSFCPPENQSCPTNKFKAIIGSAMTAAAEYQAYEREEHKAWRS